MFDKISLAEVVTSVIGAGVFFISVFVVKLTWKAAKNLKKSIDNMTFDDKFGDFDIHLQIEQFKSTLNSLKGMVTIFCILSTGYTLELAVYNQEKISSDLSLFSVLSPKEKIYFTGMWLVFFCLFVPAIIFEFRFRAFISDVRDNLSNSMSGNKD